MRGLEWTLTLIVWLLSCGTIASPAVAQSSWTDATGNWFVPGNWSAGVPTAATTTTTVGNGGTAQINGASANAGNNLVIEGLSTVDVQTGGSLTSAAVTIGPDGTLSVGSGGSILTGGVTNSGNLRISTGGKFNLNGTLDSALASSVTTLGGGTLRAISTSSVSDTVNFTNSSISTLLAAAGQTLTFSGNIGVSSGASVKIGSGTDTGTVVFAPAVTFASSPGTQTYEVLAGTWRSGSLTGLGPFVGLGLSTTVDAGATLDLNGFGVDVHALLGTGTVATGSVVQSPPMCRFLGCTTNQLTLFGASNFSGTITGVNGLVVGFGAGDTAILSGTNTYTGGTMIAAGAILQLGNGGAGGSILGDVTDNGTLIFNRSDNYTFAGAISGTGGLQQNGSGIVTLISASTYTGPTTVNAGALDVESSLSSAVTVNSGGMLTGGGTVGGLNVMSGGSFAPGGVGASGSSLTIAGNLTFQPGAIYLVQIHPSATNFAAVTGSAMLGGATMNALFSNGSSIKKQYTVLTAAGGVSGAFEPQVTTNLPANVHTTLSYDANDTYLNLILKFAAPVRFDRNQQAVSNALTDLFNANGSIPLVFSALNAAGLSQASGELATASQQTTFNAMSQFIDLMTDPFMRRSNGNTQAPFAIGYAGDGDQADANAADRNRSDVLMMFTRTSPSQAVHRWSVWAAGYGGSQSSNGNASLGSTATTSRIAGTAVGADYLFSPQTVAGFALAGGGTSFGVNNLGSGRSDLFQAGAYIRHTHGEAYISGALAYGWQHVDTNRTVTVGGFDQLRAEFNANAYSGRVEAGYRFVAPWISGFGITPYAAGQFTSFDIPAYDESVVSGMPDFALAYAAKSATTARSELGFWADRSLAMSNGTVTLRGRFAWAHDVDQDRTLLATFRTLPGASFVVNGAAQASNSVLTTASAEMQWANGWSAAATLEGQFSSVAQSYAIEAVVRYRW